MYLRQSCLFKVVAFMAICSLNAMAVNVTKTPRSVGTGGIAFGSDTCRKRTKSNCQPLQFSSCFGVKLPYSDTSPDLVNENFTQHQLQNEMLRWEGLRSSPKCWQIIQPLLCSYYMPKCEEGFIHLPSQELCKIARNPCRVIKEATKQWPEFLRCDDVTKFSSNCKNEVRELRFNTSSKCMSPMKEVENSFNYYDGFEGCALKCQDPLYTDEEHEYISNWIWYSGLLTLFSTGWVIVTYKIGWKSSNRYPSVIILYINSWYFFAAIGWFFQFFPNGKEDIVCRKDGTIRRLEPNGSENVFCLVVGLWIYFGVMSVMVWLMVFAYVWNLTCNAVGRIREKVDKQKIHFLVGGWIIPTILTVTCFAVKKVDGSSMYGICFVGFTDSTHRILLVLVPVGVAFAIISFFLAKGTYKLLSLSYSSSASDFITSVGKKEIKSNAVRVVVFSVAASVLVFTAFALQIASVIKEPTHHKALRETILCRMNFTDAAECGTFEKSDVRLMVGNVVVFFLGGILVSSWAFTSASVHIWKRSFRRFCKSMDSENTHAAVPKCDVIAKAYAKRHNLANGRISLSLASVVDDPIGLNKLLDPNHLGHQNEELSNQFSNTGDPREISSEWAENLPNLLNRRGAIIPPHSSNSVSCMSEDSRRPSCDSAISDAVRHFQGSSTALDTKRRSRKEWFRMGRRNRWHPWRRGSNRGSSSSLESNPGSQILPAITALIDKRQHSAENLLATNNQPQTRKPIILRELAIQTSFEKLNSTHNCTTTCHMNNALCMDKSTQCSIVNLKEISTQTKKSATRKKDKNKDKRDHDSCKTGVDPDDPVLKLLTPN